MLGKITKGIRHPREAMMYLLIGKGPYYKLPSKDSCCKVSDAIGPMVGHVTLPPDIHEHLTTLYVLATEFKCKTILELGTRRGESSVALANAARRTGGRLYSYDIADCIEARKLMENEGLTANWSFETGNDLEIDWKREIDFLFIDTTHEYEQTIRELTRFEALVKPGGIIALHDSVSFPPVRNAVKDYVKDRTNLNVYEFVNNNGLIVIFKS